MTEVHLRGNEICPSGHRRQQLQQVGAVEREHDAGRGSGARQVDRADAGVRHRAAHQDRVQHARQDEIGDELPLAGQQPAVFAPQQRAPDIGSSNVVAAGEYTIADMICYPWASSWATRKIDIDEFPNVKRWLEEIGERPAVKKAMALGPEFREDPASISADEQARRASWSRTSGRSQSQRNGWPPRWRSCSVRSHRRKQWRQPSTVEAARMSAEEWQTRCDLAACYRLVDMFGWSDLINTRITARVPGEHDHFLISPYGLLFDEVTASSLVKIDAEGNKVEPTEREVNSGGFAIPSAIHMARPELACVLHTHTDRRLRRVDAKAWTTAAQPACAAGDRRCRLSRL